MITDAQKKKYIDRDGARCIYCESDQVEYGKLEWDEPIMIEVTCLDCEKSWWDMMKIYDVVEDETRQQRGY